MDVAAALEGRGEAVRDDGDLEATATGLILATGILGCGSVLGSGDSVDGEGTSLGLRAGGGDLTESFALDE